MSYNFDTITDRRNTDCIKYDWTVERGKPKDVLSLWVADMDFPTLPEVSEAIRKAADHGIYGYTEPKNPYYEALSGWFSRRFDFAIQKDWIVKTPGVVFALALAVRTFTEVGDSVLIQRPVYYPFSQVIEANGRKVVSNSLVIRKGKDARQNSNEDGCPGFNPRFPNTYAIDFEDFEKKIVKHQIRLFLLCSPHNPVGRVWTEDELRRMAEICKKHDCVIVSDEIHCDFVFPGNKHFVLPSLSEKIADNVMLCTAPSKTFNLAGLQISNIIIPSIELRKRVLKELEKTGFSQCNTTGLVACRAAYEHGEPWLEALLVYLKGNLDFAMDFLAKKLPQVDVIVPQGTYLLWLDFRKTAIAPKELDHFIVHKAKLWLDSGEIFGDEGLGFQRINIACPRSVLAECLERLQNAFA
ncbi:MAG: pyridoxal phosphate-dependent aminotransferase [Clostridiales Family XIII bacterium]|jgi:cystathionine beta-lyase|nr:pyridoxal phosphate-dependent aminotransferase [Clostridiales Family XIII bacterium]